MKAKINLQKQTITFSIRDYDKKIDLVKKEARKEIKQKVLREILDENKTLKQRYTNIRDYCNPKFKSELDGE